MNRNIKLIWDFRGPAAKKTSEHHCIHLKEFVAMKKLDCHEINYTKLSDYHTIAFIIIDEKDMITFRDALKPHRGEFSD